MDTEALSKWISSPAVAVPLVLLLVFLYLTTPRKAKNKDAPPMVKSNIPFIGTVLEFAKSPVKMVRRCYDDYGPVFTVPVSDF
jgi:hypothetical protein